MEAKQLNMEEVQNLIEDAVERAVARTLKENKAVSPPEKKGKWIYGIAYAFLGFLIVDWVFFNHFTLDGWTLIPSIDPDYKSMINVMMYSVMGSLLTLAGVIINNKDKNERLPKMLEAGSPTPLKGQEYD